MIAAAYNTIAIITGQGYYLLSDTYYNRLTLYYVVFPAVTENTSESYHNMQTIMALLKHKGYDFLKQHALFSYSFDYKMGAVFFGIGSIGRLVDII